VAPSITTAVNNEVVLCGYSTYGSSLQNPPTTFNNNQTGSNGTFTQVVSQTTGSGNNGMLSWLLVSSSGTSVNDSYAYSNFDFSIGLSISFKPQTTVYSFVGAGAVYRAYNAACTPALPAGVNVGDLLILQSQMQVASGNIYASSLTVAGWTFFGPPSGSGVQQLGVWGRLAAGSDSASVNWSQFGNINCDSNAWIVAYRGNANAAPASLVHATSYQLATNNGGLNYSNLSITQPNCLVLLCGVKNNNSTSNSATFNTATSSSGGPWSIDQSIVENLLTPIDISCVTNRSIQISQTMTINDGSPVAYATFSIALLSSPPPPGIPGPIPRQVYVLP
jgi:hypothetical protein